MLGDAVGADSFLTPICLHFLLIRDKPSWGFLGNRFWDEDLGVGDFLGGPAGPAPAGSDDSRLWHGAPSPGSPCSRHRDGLLASIATLASPGRQPAPGRVGLCAAFSLRRAVPESGGGWVPSAPEPSAGEFRCFRLKEGIWVANATTPTTSF